MVSLRYLADFDDAQAKGLAQAMTETACANILRGCFVHWTRSLNRVAKLVTKSAEEKNVFLELGKRIPDLDKQEDVLKAFDILSGQIPVKHIAEILDFRSVGFETTHWKRLRHWAEWWCRKNHLQMFTKSFSVIDDSVWEGGPRTTNPVESLNRQSIHEKGSSLHSLLENIYTEDRVHAAKIATVKVNVTSSYSGTPEAGTAKKKRKRSSPDKRRNLEELRGNVSMLKGKRDGKSLIGTKLATEYQEANDDGEMQYLGWFHGTVTAFNRRDGYFVEYHEQVCNGRLHAKWSEWLDTLDNDDVKLIEEP